VSSDSSSEPETPVQSGPELPSAVVQRYQRYKAVISYVSAQSTIDLQQSKEACQPEQPGFVTKVIRELEKSGWLVAENASGISASDSRSFRWNQSRGQFKAEKWLDEKIFGSQILNSPSEERPRERLLQYGASQLGTSELLAILIRSGRPGESAVDAGAKLARQFQDRLGDLPSAGRGELKEISGAVEVTAYCQIMAGIELGRRVAMAMVNRAVTRIGSSSDAIAFCEQKFSRLISDARQEEFHIVTLDTKHQVLDTHRITVGTLDASLVHPREVFRRAIKDAASAIILVHNHPSGDPTPSREDLAVTKRMNEAGELMGIRVIDHIVLGAFRSVSIREWNNGL
jgi:DNA repair protein RadC